MKSMILCVLSTASAVLARWHAGRTDPIDALIAKNKARWCAGMDKPEWSKFRLQPETAKTIRFRRYRCG